MRHPRLSRVIGEQWKAAWWIRGARQEIMFSFFLSAFILLICGVCWGGQFAKPEPKVHFSLLFIAVVVSRQVLLSWLPHTSPLPFRPDGGCSVKRCPYRSHSKESKRLLAHTSRRHLPLWHWRGRGQPIDKNGNATSNVDHIFWAFWKKHSPVRWRR